MSFSDGHWRMEGRLIKTAVDLHGGEEENLIDINISPARKCHGEGYIQLIHRTDIEVEGECEDFRFYSFLFLWG